MKVYLVEREDEESREVVEVYSSYDLASRAVFELNQLYYGIARHSYNGPYEVDAKF